MGNRIENIHGRTQYLHFVRDFRFGRRGRAALTGGKQIIRIGIPDKIPAVQKRVARSQIVNPRPFDNLTAAADDIVEIGAVQFVSVIRFEYFRFLVKQPNLPAFVETDEAGFYRPRIICETDRIPFRTVERDYRLRSHFRPLTRRGLGYGKPDLRVRTILSVGTAVSHQIGIFFSAVRKVPFDYIRSENAAAVPAAFGNGNTGFRFSVAPFSAAVTPRADGYAVRRFVVFDRIPRIENISGRSFLKSGRMFVIITEALVEYGTDSVEDLFLESFRRPSVRRRGRICRFIASSKSRTQNQCQKNTDRLFHVFLLVFPSLYAGTLPFSMQSLMDCLLSSNRFPTLKSP